MVRFVQYVQKLVFFWKKVGFFEKELLFFKIGKGGKFAEECVSTDIISPYRVMTTAQT